MSMMFQPYDEEFFDRSKSARAVTETRIDVQRLIEESKRRRDERRDTEPDFDVRSIVEIALPRFVLRLIGRG